MTLVPIEADNTVLSGAFVSYTVNRELLLPEFLDYYFKIESIWKEVGSRSTGTNMRRKMLHPQQFEKSLIKIPSIEEQKEIVDKLFCLSKSIQKINSLIFEQIQSCKVLRQAIFQEAVQGKLTKQNNDDEPADKLLQRIKAEKQKLIAADKLKKEKELQPITEGEMPFELPKGWVWCRLGEITNLVSGVTLGKTYKEELTQVPYLRVANVQRGYVDITHLKELAVTKSEIEKYALREGDLVMIEGGEWDKVGRCAIWNGEVKPCIHQNHIFRLRFYGSILNQWAELFLNSPVARRYFESCSKQTTNLASINKTQLTNALFPLPPLLVQHHIVTKVQQLLQIVNQLEQQVEQSHAQAQQLLQAVLKEAFTSKDKVYEMNDVITMAAEPAPVYDKGTAHGLTEDEQLQLYFICLNIFAHKDKPEEATLGDVKMEKTCHIGEYLLKELKFNRNAEKQQFGPADFKRLYRLHDYAETNDIFVYDKFASYRKYEAGDNFMRYIKEALGKFRPFIKQVKRLFDLLQPLNTNKTDILATTFAAWNNLLINKQPVSLKAVAAEARWHSRKLNFTDADFIEAMDFLTINKIEPAGTGRRVT